MQKNEDIDHQLKASFNTESADSVDGPETSPESASQLSDVDSTSSHEGGAIAFVISNLHEKQHAERMQKTLTEAQIVHETFVCSGILEPLKIKAWAEKATSSGFCVIIVIANREPQLPWQVAAFTNLPVIALPIATDITHFSNAIPQTSKSIPVAIIPPGDWRQAFYLALRIAALINPKAVMLLESISDGYKKIQVAEEETKKRNPKVEHGSFKKNLASTDEIEKEFMSYKKEFMKTIEQHRNEAQRRRNPMQEQVETEILKEAKFKDAPLRDVRNSELIKGLVSISGDNPEFEIIEAAADNLMRGGVIAIPTDTVYGIAVDATNPDAVQKLYELKGRDTDKAIPLLIHTIRLLEEIAPGLVEEARALAKVFWPGPLTLVLPRQANTFEAVTTSDTIGVRLPDNFVALSVISMVGRPLAVTSANPSGKEPAETGEKVAEYFGSELDIILNAGAVPGGPVSTVLNVAVSPFEILREGKISRDQLAKLLPNMLK
jgi:L-threonylcarbamoyladenylate synthase